MAETIKIEVFKKKDVEAFVDCLADPDSRLDAGGGAAACAALSAALMSRAAALTAREVSGNERLDYILRNSETLRKYMAHLIDEDVRCRGPLRKARQEGDAQRIEAASQSATAICAEIVNMSVTAMDLLDDLSKLCSAAARPYVRESAELALAAMRTARHYILGMSETSSDETYRFVVRRENEITASQVMPVYEGILERLG